MINNNFSYNQFSFCGKVDKSVSKRLDNILNRDIENIVSGARENKTKVNTVYLQSLRIRKCAILKVLEQKMKTAHPQTIISIPTPELTHDKETIIRLSNALLPTKVDVSYKLNNLSDFERMTKDINSTTLGMFEKEI